MPRREKPIIIQPCTDHHITTDVTTEGVVIQTCADCGAAFVFDEMPPASDVEMDEVADLLMELLAI